MLTVFGTTQGENGLCVCVCMVVFGVLCECFDIFMALAKTSRQKCARCWFIYPSEQAILMAIAPEDHLCCLLNSKQPALGFLFFFFFSIRVGCVCVWDFVRWSAERMFLLEKKKKKTKMVEDKSPAAKVKFPLPNDLDHFRRKRSSATPLY